MADEPTTKELQDLAKRKAAQVQINRADAELNPAKEYHPVERTRSVLGGLKGGTTIIAGTVTATGLTVLRQLLEGNLSMRPIISGFVVGTGLLVLGFFSTPIAAALALLLVVTSVLMNAPPILEKVGGFAR